MKLEIQFPDGAWNLLGKGLTDSDGRARNLLPEGAALTAAVYRLTFDNLPDSDLYPEVTVSFHVRDTARHYGIRIAIVGDSKEHSTRDLLSRLRRIPHA